MPPSQGPAESASSPASHPLRGWGGGGRAGCWLSVSATLSVRQMPRRTPPPPPPILSAPRSVGSSRTTPAAAPATAVTRRHSRGANADTASVTEPVRPIHGGRGDKVTAPRRSRDHSHGAAAVKRHRRGRIRRGAPAHAGRSEDLSMTQPSCGSAWNSRRLSTQFLS